MELINPDHCPGNRWFAMVAYMADACNVPEQRGKRFKEIQAHRAAICAKDVQGWAGYRGP